MILCEERVLYYNMFESVRYFDCECDLMFYLSVHTNDHFLHIIINVRGYLYNVANIIREILQLASINKFYRIIATTLSYKLQTKLMAPLT